MKKRGLSNVIVVVLMILLTIAIIGILWVTVSKFMESAEEQISHENIINRYEGTSETIQNQTNTTTQNQTNTTTQNQTNTTSNNTLNTSFLMGMNTNMFNYWSSDIPMVNLMTKAGASFNEVPINKYGFPLEIPYTAPDGSVTNMVSVVMITDESNSLVPGNHKLILEGEGRIRLQWDTGNIYYDSPGIYDVMVTPNMGIFLSILESNKTKPISKIQFIMPGYENSPDSFHPKFLEYLEGVSVIRYMDWGRVNGENIVSWNDRGTPNDISQEKVFIKKGEITSITETTPTPFSGNWVAQVVTTEPHGLITGQTIDISGTDAGFEYRDSGGALQELRLENVYIPMVEVIDDYTFNTHFVQIWERWYNTPGSNKEFVGFIEDDKGEFEIEIKAGVAYEYMAALSNELGADAWITVPHLADDNYVRNMTSLLKATLNPEIKVYVEYSNEVWNSGFSQRRYADSMGKTLGGDNQFYAKRSAEIFKIFEEEFGGSERLVKVLSSQAVNAGRSRAIFNSLNDPALNPHNIQADALAIAPYFGGGVDNIIVENDQVGTITTEEILEIARTFIYEYPEDPPHHSTQKSARIQKEVADEFGVELIAYEGGQHILAGGANRNNVVLVDKLIEANRHPGMEGLYDEMFTVWSNESDDSLFTVYNYMTTPSQYGSWGMLEYQSQETSPKYRSIRKAINNSLQ